jgi:protein XRP2
MGCSASNEKKPVGKFVPKTPPTFGKPANLNRLDYMFTKQNDSVCVKPPGTINGQQFIVEDCGNCDIYLLDCIAAMTVDSCKACRLITGPISGSIFLRDCSNCIIVTMCQQLRLRNCHNLSKYQSIYYVAIYTTK